MRKNFEALLLVLHSLVFHRNPNPCGLDVFLSLHLLLLPCHCKIIVRTGAELLCSIRSQTDAVYKSPPRPNSTEFCSYFKMGLKGQVPAVRVRTGLFGDAMKYSPRFLGAVERLLREDKKQHEDSGLAPSLGEQCLDIVACGEYVRSASGWANKAPCGPLRL